MNTEKPKIVAIVKANDSHWYVFDRIGELKYDLVEPDLLIGSDDSGIFYNVLVKRPMLRDRAFGGREFELPLRDGGSIHCKGQWWSGGQERAESHLGIELGEVGAETEEGLKSCYVFTQYDVNADAIKELESEYFHAGGHVYEYQEYEDILRKRVDM